MRLTKTLKRAFVRAVMADVPHGDFDEQARKLAQDFLYEKLPPKIKAIYDDKALRGYLNEVHVNFPGVLSDHMLVSADFSYNQLLNTRVWDELRVLADAKQAQRDARTSLGYKLEAVVAGCRTSEALLAQLPEFEKYLPKEAAPTPMLPATANVVADFIKAGWPKGD